MSVQVVITSIHTTPSSSPDTHRLTLCHAHTSLSHADVGDERLAIVRELLRTEDAYLENLRNIFDIYMEPLR